MYAKRIITLRQNAALPALRKVISPDFDYEERSLKQVDSFITHMKGVAQDGAGYAPLKYTRELTPEEVKWILNERTLCTCDFVYWATRYARIRDISNRIIHYTPNLAQKVFLSILEEMENDELELILQFLKARRLGISTICQLILAHRFIFHPNTFGIIASDNPSDSDKLSKMFFLAYEHTPAWLRPQIVRYSKGAYYGFSNGNRVDIEHGSQESDMGRGENPNLAHISECAKLQDPEMLIDSGLMRAVLPNPSVFMVFEGTAEGDTGWWPDKYWWNKQHYGKPGTGARMRATFLPWYTGADIYPTPMWLKSNKWEAIKDTWQPNPNTVKESQRAAEFVQQYPLLRKHLGKNWVMPVEQMYFYEASIQEYKRNNTLHVWAREMVSNDLSAFVSGELSVFDAELRFAYRQSCPPPLKVYGIRGGGIPERFWPSKKDMKLVGGKPVIMPVVADWTPSLPPLKFEFVELKFEGYSNTNPVGKLFLWEEPQNAETYAFGADPSDGLGEKRSDNSVIQMFRKGHRFKMDAQVAEFASPDMSGADLWLIGMAVGTYFSVYVNGKVRQPRCVPEINREGGRTFLKEMMRHGWKSESFHVQVKMKATRRGQPSISYGWYADSQNQHEMIQRGIQAIKEEYIELNSPWLVSEMDTLIYDRANHKIGAAKGKHDDRLIALWLPFVSIYDDEIRATGKSPFQERQRAITPSEQYPIWTNQQAFDEDAEVIRY